ncbi:MAG: tyrosine-type recombinase/integrase [Acaryochloridaceae cyanobacterium RU_4_10]|nr:tyrosine-type recombinase/integrase [Acaryochloridaceae cyanobacterium RU_4_10]
MEFAQSDRVPAVKLVMLDFAKDEVIHEQTLGAVRSRRGRPEQIATPADIRWPMVQEFLRSSNLSVNTRKLYERELKRFLGWTQCPWSDLKLRHLGSYKEYLMDLEVSEGKTLAKNSLNSALTAIKSYFKWLCQYHPELCPVNPTEGLKFEKVPLPPAQSLTPEEMDRVWNAIAQRTETRLRDLVLVHLLAHALRAGEVVSANVGSFDGRLVTITQTKNKKPRIVPLSQAGQQAVQDYLAARRERGEAVSPESALILSHHQGWEGDRLSYHGIYFAVERIGELAQLPNLHPHQFRHTGATSLLRMGIDPAHVRRLIGHEDERSTRRYTLAYEQEGAIEAFYRAQRESNNEQVVYAKGLSREQRQLLIGMAEMTGKTPLYQDDLDQGEVSFARLWQENIAGLERMLEDVKRLPERLGVAVEKLEDVKRLPQKLGVAAAERETVEGETYPMFAKLQNHRQEINVLLKVKVEDRTLAGRSKAKVRREIENQILVRYQVVKLGRGEYDLTIPFEKEDEVAVIVSEMLWEMDTLAELEDCWVEHEFTGVVL